MGQGRARLKTRPPMPWFALHDMHEHDLRAFYRFVRSLGPVGSPAPAYVPPGQTPNGPYAQFPSCPQMSSRSGRRASPRRQRR